MEYARYKRVNNVRYNVSVSGTPICDGEEGIIEAAIEQLPNDFHKLHSELLHLFQCLCDQFFCQEVVGQG